MLPLGALRPPPHYLLFIWRSLDRWYCPDRRLEWGWARWLQGKVVTGAACLGGAVPAEPGRLSASLHVPIASCLSASL